MGQEKKLALITGAGRGIGKVIALQLAKSGADIALTDLNPELEDLKSELNKLGSQCLDFQVDVTDPEAIDKMVSEVVGRQGRIDILVNNAGIASRGQSVEQTDPAELQRVVATHAFGPHYLSKLVIPKMRTLDRGDIVMISSVATRSLSGFGAPYNMGKTAMEALAYTLAKEERPHGIRVNIVAPGLVDTDMGQRLMNALQGVEDLRTLDQSMPWGRVCQPDDVANVVKFLVSEANSYLTGERLYCDGGGQDINRR